MIFSVLDTGSRVVSESFISTFAVGLGGKDKVEPDAAAASSFARTLGCISRPTLADPCENEGRGGTGTLGGSPAGEKLCAKALSLAALRFAREEGRLILFGGIGGGAVRGAFAICRLMGHGDEHLFIWIGVNAIAAGRAAVVVIVAGLLVLDVEGIK